MSKIIKSIFIPEDGSASVVKIPVPDKTEFVEPELEPDESVCTEPDSEIEKRNPEEEAAEILAKAQEQAAALLEQAKEEAEQLREQARQLGFQQGQIEGKQAVEAEYAAGLAEFKELAANICLQLNQERCEIIASAQEDLLKIILIFAEKIIKTTISADPTILLNILKEAVERVAGVTRAEVRLHPQDLNTITQIAGDMELATPTTTLDFVPDSKLARNSCVVTTSKLTVEASVDAQTAELEAVLRQALQKEAAASGS